MAGRVLEGGGGHGLLAAYCALGSAQRDVLGVDVDGRKVEVARRAGRRATEAGARLEFGVDHSVPRGPWDAVALVDVCYLLDQGSQQRLLEDCAEQLAPRGKLLVKGMSRRPLAKHWWDVAQETLAVKVLRVTQGDSLSFLDPAQHARWLEGLGLQVRCHSLHRGYPHPHHLLVGTAHRGP